MTFAQQLCGLVLQDETPGKKKQRMDSSKADAELLAQFSASHARLEQANGQAKEPMAAETAAEHAPPAAEGEQQPLPEQGLAMSEQ